MAQSHVSSESATVPRLEGPQLSRARLVDRLRTLPAGGVAVLTAPVGFGATSLLAAAVQGHPGPVLWRSARSAVSGEAEMLWRWIGEALRSDPEAPGILLVLDDVPHDAAFDTHLQRLLDDVPTGLRVMISTRREPTWELTALLASGRLLVLDRQALTLTPEEADEYVRALAPDLVADRRAALVAAAGGWLGALRASVSATAADPGGDPAAWLLGPGLDLLFRRSIAGLVPVDRDMLVTCSVLDLVSADACRALTGRDDGAERLSSLAQRLLLARRIDEGQVLYEVEPLLREYLRRLLSERGRGAARDAHRAAGLWLAEQGDAHAAITHLLDCGDVHQAREVLASHVRALLDQGQSDRVRTWYRQAPELAVPDHQLHLLGAAWSEVLSGDIAAARPHLIELEATARTPDASGAGTEAELVATEWLAAEATLLRAYVDAWDGHTTRALAGVIGYRALSGGQWTRMSHQAAAFHEVRLHLWHGDAPAARALLAELSSRPGTLQYYRGVAVPSLAALVAAHDGRAHRACFLAGSALHAVDTSGRVGASDDCDALLARALAHVDLGQVAQGDADATQLEQTASAIHHVPYQVLAATTRARSAAVAQDLAAAEEHLERARQVLRAHAAGGQLAQAVAVAQVDVAFLSGERTSARRALAHLPPGRSRDRLAIRVLGMGGGINDSEVVRQIQLVRPETPREVVDARMLMAALTAPSRPTEAEMHLREAAAVATEAGLLTALRGRADVVQALAQRLARQPGESAIAALVDAQVDAAETAPPAVPPLGPGERDLLVRLAQRPGNRELAEDLGISTNTLKTRLRRLYSKLGVHDRDAALRVAGPR